MIEVLLVLIALLLAVNVAVNVTTFVRETQPYWQRLGRKIRRK